VNRILLIEDDSSAQLLYGNRLTDLGYQVVLAATGALGLMEARSGPFDLFLVDIDLGKGIDGYEVCRRLKTIPEIHGVPVVLISGHVKTQEDLHRGYEAGCQSFLVKGDLMLLEDVVRAMLRIKTLQDELAVQNRLLGRVEAEKARGSEADAPGAGTGRGGARAPVRPDALLLVDGEGVVRTSDRGARDLFGQAIEGKHLAVLAPESRLEATVRNARTEAHEGIRFEIPERAGRAGRTMVASIHPFVPQPDPSQPSLRLVELFTVGRRGTEGAAGESTRQPVLAEAARLVFRPAALAGTSLAIRELRARVGQLAQTEAPVLVLGPRGSGKSFLARVLHVSGPRPGAFVPLACAPGPNAEAELFGSAAESGGEAQPGAVHRAQGGTLFLQDIERLSPDLQRRLLELVRTGRVTRRGATTPERIDVRVVASVRSDGRRGTVGALLSELEACFAGSLLQIPALRERSEDVPALARHFLTRLTTHDQARFSDQALQALKAHDWPDDVRELEQTVHRAVEAAAGPEVTLGDLPGPFAELPTSAESAKAERELSGLESELGRLRASLDSTVSLLDAYEKGALLHALQLSRGDKLRAAKLLRIGKSTFYRKLKQHGIT